MEVRAEAEAKTEERQLGLVSEGVGNVVGVGEKKGVGEGEKKRRKGVGKGDGRQGIRLTERDRVLLGHLAGVRYLSRDQLWRLAFPGRVESVVAERLAGLLRLNLLRRLYFRTVDGWRVEVWALTQKGYRVAEDLVGPYERLPLHDVQESFLAHEVGLVELYLGALGVTQEMLGPKRRQGSQRLSGRPPAEAPQAALPVDWRWVSGDKLRLHLEKPDGRKPIQILQPDAVVEFPHAHPTPRRLFLEWETGKNPLVAANKARTTSLEGKLERYTKFFTDFVGLGGFQDNRTWYTQAFPDNWEVRVRFVVHSERRKANSLEVLKSWRAKAGARARSIDFNVQTSEEAIREMRWRLGLTAHPPKSPLAHKAVEAFKSGLTQEQLKTLTDFYNQSVIQVKTLRHQVRDTNAERGLALPVPDYVPTAKVAGELIQSLRVALGAQAMRAEEKR